MSVVVDPLQSEKSIVRTEPRRGPLPHISPARWGRPREQWKSALSQEDLQCLLQVIEGDLIPRLVAEYCPARQAPLPVAGSKG